MNTAVNDLCTTFHFGWVGDVPPNGILTSSNEVVIANTVLGDFHFERSTACVGGSSGSPVFSHDLRTLLGVHFAAGGCAVKQTVLFTFMTNSLVVTAYTDRIDQLWSMRNFSNAAISISENIEELRKYLEKNNYHVFLM